MTAPAPAPTAYPNINELLTDLRESLQATLGDTLVGLYLSGSLASGDFDPASSDIDFVAVTATAIDRQACAALQRLHERLSVVHPRLFRHTEGAYLPLPVLRCYIPDGHLVPILAIGGNFAMVAESWDGVFHRHILRESAVVLAGPHPRGLIDPVSPADLRRATAGLLAGWWSDQLRDPSFLTTREYQAFAVLTMCRALYTLEHGELCSKSAAARWATAHLPPPFPAWIERAQRWRTDPTPDLEALPDTLAFIRLALERVREGNGLPGATG